MKLTPCHFEQQQQQQRMYVKSCPLELILRTLLLLLLLTRMFLFFLNTTTTEAACVATMYRITSKVARLLWSKKGMIDTRRSWPGDGSTTAVQELRLRIPHRTLAGMHTTQSTPEDVRLFFRLSIS